MVREDLGKIEVKPERCQVARWCSLEVVYTVGEKEITAGGGIRFLMPKVWSHPQSTDPRAAGFTRVDYPPSIAAEVNFKFNSVWFKVTGGVLLKGKRIVLHYGERSQGAPGGKAAIVPSKDAPDAAAFHVAVSLGEGEDFVFIDPPGKMEIETGEATRFLVSVPSLLSRGEEVKGRIAAVDDFANPDERFVGEAAVNGKTVRFEKKDRGRKQFEFRVGEPGIVNLRAEDKEERISGTSNPVEIIREQRKLRLFWGDIHVHSQLSDAFGFPDKAYVYAREVAGLDFAAIADHDWVFNELIREPHHAIDEAGWEKLKKTNDDFYEPGKFVTLLGYEWIREEKGKPGSNFGHMNIYYRANDGKFFPPGKTKSDDPRQVASLVEKEKNAMLIPHQTLYSSPDLLTNPIKLNKMRLVEIYSGWGSSEKVGGLLVNEPVRKNILKRVRKGESVQQYLAAGYRFGFFSSSDTHLTSPGRMPKERVAYALPTSHRGGLAAVYAEELTREAIFDALWERRVYAVTGARIILEFFVNGNFMGSEIKAEGGPRKIRARVIGQGPVARVDLVKNNRDIHTWKRPGNGDELTFSDEKPEKTADYYYIRVVQEDGEMAWASPVWVEEK